MKLGAGLVATMAALVLGLLVGSAKSSFDAMNTGITQIGARTIMLDHALAHYGPEAKDVREIVRGATETAIRQIWPEDGSGQVRLDVIEKGVGMERIQAGIRGLTPQDDAQREFRSQALQIASDLAQLRWTLIEQRTTSLPTTFLVVLVFWLSMLFASFGMFAPRNATVIAVLSISALSVAGAIFIVLEMNTPLEGLIKISSAPLHKALEYLGK